jgi:5-methylcytosine-specific restriction endonuclease McrA
MALKRKFAAPRDPRRTHPKLRDDLRRRVFAMSDGNCAICHRPVDTALAAGSPLSPELDEIIPVSRGGAPYDIDNLQLTHRACNRKKGAKMVGDDILEDINPTPNSRQW